MQDCNDIDYNDIYDNCNDALSQACVCNLKEKLTFGTNDWHVQVSKAGGKRQGHLDHLLWSDCVAVEVVEQGSLLVVVGHQPKLSRTTLV